MLYIHKEFYSVSKRSTFNITTSVDRMIFIMFVKIYDLLMVMLRPVFFFYVVGTIWK